MDLDHHMFWRGIGTFHKAWKAGVSVEGSVYHGIDALCIVVGKQNDAAFTGECLHRYLFGVFMTNVVLVLKNDGVIFFSNAKKCKLVKGFVDKAPEEMKEFGKLEIIDMGKEAATVSENVEKLISTLKACGKKVGALLKPSPIGSFGESFSRKLAESELELLDVEAGVQAVIMENDRREISFVEKSSSILVRALRKTFVKTMEDVFENDKKMANHRVAEKISESLKKPTKLKLKAFKVEDSDVEASVEPIVQSGGKYDIDLSTAQAFSEKNKDVPLTSDVLLCTMNLSYKDYNAILARTYFVDPVASQKTYYNALVAAHDAVIKALVPGTSLGDVYGAGCQALEKEYGGEDISKHLFKEMGWGIGVDYKLPGYVIRASNARIVTEGMTFVVYTALQNLGPKGEKEEKKIKTKNYSLVIANTVVVERSKGARVLSASDYSYGNIHYNIEGSDDEDEDDDEEDNDVEIVNTVVGTRTRVTRSTNKSKEELEREKEAASLESKMARLQAKLMKEKAEQALAEASSGKKKKKKKKDQGEEEAKPTFESFKSSSDYPTDLSRNQIYCDKASETILLPMGGLHVPFHISTIKTVTKIEEERATLLRIHFIYPTGKAFASSVPKSMVHMMQENPHFQFIKELGFRSKDQVNLNLQYRLIRELQKKVRARQKEIELEADIVEQKDLVLSRDQRRRNPQLDQVSMKPALRKGKCVGRLVAHVNGFRFRTNNGETFDLIYGNIAHFFFQECKKELNVLVHFNLKHPIKIGRSKTYDIQFYTEVVEASSALDRKHRNMNDPDEELEERREKMLKKRLNAEFREFCKSVVRVVEENNQRIGVDNDFDVPYRKLAFKGVHSKEMVTMMPTVHCLVNLTETPFLVVPLDDIEHIHFERVNNHTKNFDMVVILKKHLTPDNGVPQRITSIPIESMDTIKRWLFDKGDITFTTGTTSLNWKGVLESIYGELEDGVFWKDKDIEGNDKDVGWNFLRLDNDESEDDDDGSESDFGAEDAESDEEEEEDDWGDDMEEEESSEADDSEDEDAPDWDDLEKEARRSDKKKDRRDFADDEDFGRGSKKKRKR